MPFLTSNVTNNLTVDGVYVYLQSPQGIGGVGVPTSLAGIVGTGAWGPLNTLLPFSDTASLYSQVGSLSLNITNGTPDAKSIAYEGYCATAYSNNFYAVRVDNSDSVAASGTLTDSASATVPVSALYTGQVGNTITVSLSQGSMGSGFITAQVVRAGYQPEVFANMAVGTGGAFWTTLSNALANGLSSQRGASQLIRLGAISSTHTPVVPQVISLSGGSNGTAPSSAQIGVDSSSVGRTGMYVLRGTGISQFILAGNSDVTLYGTMATFAASEESLAICAMPQGTLTTNAALTAKGTLSSVNAAIILGWITIYDPGIGANRVVSPLGMTLGYVASLPPEASPGNGPVGGFPLVLAVERSGNPYSFAEASILQQNGIMYMGTMPRGGNGIGFANGCNSAATPGSAGVNYIRMNNFLGQSIANLLGIYVDQLQGPSQSDPTRALAKAAIVTFLQGLQNANRIAAFNVQLDTTNNTAATIAAGFCFATVSVEFLAAIQYFDATIQGGQAVIITQNANVV